VLILLSYLQEVLPIVIKIAWSGNYSIKIELIEGKTILFYNYE
jgi:hypothetical protein